MRTAPDINVRAARHHAAGSARRARRCALARMLLGVAWKLLLPFAVTSSVPACIIPVAPEFQDPDGIPNSQPQIIDPDPDWGDEVTGTTSRLFEFTITDPNPTDDLYVQVIVDVTRFALKDKETHHDDGTPIRKRLPALVECTDVDPTLARHSVKGIVADRPFSPTLVGVVPDPTAQMDIITWTLDMNCQAAAP